jgi:hypothetical protein
MKFSEKDRKDLEREFEETRFPQSHMANLIGVSNAYMSGFLSGLRQPTDENVRGMYCIFGIVRESYRTTAGFKLDQKSMAMLRKRLAEMKKSIVRRPGRNKPADDDAEEGRKCRTTTVH